jgi:hypothetical protein
MHEMGFSENHQFCVVKHDHPDGEHVHIVASRIGLDASLFYGVDENLLSTKVIGELEIKYGLVLTKQARINETTGLPSVRSSKKKPKRGESEKSVRLGIRASRLVVQEAVDAILATATSIEEFSTELENRGIIYEEKSRPGGQIVGVTFQIGESSFGGSKLGDLYKYSAIHSRILANRFYLSNPKPAAKENITMHENLNPNPSSEKNARQKAMISEPESLKGTQSALPDAPAKNQILANSTPHSMVSRSVKNTIHEPVSVDAISSPASEAAAPQDPWWFVSNALYESLCSRNIHNLEQLADALLSRGIDLRGGLEHLSYHGKHFALADLGRGDLGTIQRRLEAGFLPIHRGLLQYRSLESQKQDGRTWLYERYGEEDTGIGETGLAIKEDPEAMLEVYRPATTLSETDAANLLIIAIQAGIDMPFQIHGEREFILKVTAAARRLGIPVVEGTPLPALTSDDDQTTADRSRMR